MSLRTRKWFLLIAFMLSTVLLTGKAFAAEIGENNDSVSIQILTVNDFHGALAENGKNIGAAKLVQFLKEAKAQESAGTLLMSAGDMFQGTPDSNLLYGKTVVDIMNYASFDAMTLGNHEFDWGVDVLKQRIAQSSFPYICANIIDKRTGKRAEFVKPYILLERNGVKIAVVGIATPETAIKTNPKMIADYSFADPASVVNTLVPEMRKLGADIIVVLTHLGSSMDSTGQISGDAAVLAMSAEGIDGVISGHSHQVVFGKVNEIPIVQAGNNGRAVGKIELVYNKKSRKVESSTSSVTLLPHPCLREDAKAKAIIDHAQTENAAVKRVVLGNTRRPLSHDRYQMKETLLGQWVTDAMRQAVGADVAFQNTGGLRTGIPAGTITAGNLYEVLPFDNTLYTLEMSGKQIVKVLEYGLMNDKVGMLQYSGIKVKYNPANLQDNRIVAITLENGKPLQMEKTYRVVTNDFMAAGGDGFTMFKAGKNLFDTCIPVRDVLADTIRKQKTIEFLEDNRFEIERITQNKQDVAA